MDTVNPYTIAIYSGTPDAATATINILSDSRYTFTVDPMSAPGTIRVLAIAVGTGAETLTWQGNVTGQRDFVGHQDHRQLVQQSGRCRICSTWAIG